MGVSVSYNTVLQTVDKINVRNEMIIANWKQVFKHFKYSKKC